MGLAFVWGCDRVFLTIAKKQGYVKTPHSLTLLHFIPSSGTSSFPPMATFPTQLLSDPSFFLHF